MSNNLLFKQYVVQECGGDVYQVVDVINDIEMCVCQNCDGNNNAKYNAEKIASALNDIDNVDDYYINSTREEILIWSGYQEVIFNKTDLEIIESYFKGFVISSNSLRDYVKVNNLGRKATEKEALRLMVEDYIFDEKN